MKMKLFVLILCSTFSTICAYSAATEIHMQIWGQEPNLKCEPAYNVSLILGMSFQINVNSEGIICRSRCRKNDAIGTVVAQEDHPGRHDMSIFIKPTQLGTSHYYCDFYSYPCDTSQPNACYYWKDGYTTLISATTCLIEINVRNPPRISYSSGYIDANGWNYTSGTNNYYFYKGEPLDFTCYKTVGKFVMLSYQSEGNKLVSTGLQSANSENLYVKLVTDWHKANLTCTFTDDQNFSNKQELRLRLIYTNPEDHKDILGFKVNGLIMPINNNVNKETIYYIHNKNHCESLSVSLLRNNQLYGPFSCVVTGQNVPVKLYNDLNSNLSNKNLKTKLCYENLNLFLSCSGYNLSVDQKQGKHTISLKFIYRDHNYSPFIDGLRMANILFMIKINNNIRIRYEYTGNEKLHLTCVGPTDTYWDNNKQEVIEEWNEGSQPTSFQLKPNVNNTVLKCILSSDTERVTHLQLFRKQSDEATTTSSSDEIFSKAPRVTKSPIKTESSKYSSDSNLGTPIARPSAFPGNDASTRPPEFSSTTISAVAGSSTVSSPGSTDVQATDTKNSRGKGTGSTGIWIVVAACLVPLIVVALILWTIGHIRRRKLRDEHSDPNIDYQNLPHHNEGPMSTPSQWDMHHYDYPIYAEPHNIDNLYSKPVPKSNRSIEPTYASMQESNQATELTNASMQESFKSVHTEEPYAEVGKNRQYQNLDMIQISKNQMLYAEMNPNSAIEDQVVLSPRSANYVQVVHKKPEERNYANVQELKCEYQDVSGRVGADNVQNGIEPTYCAMNDLKKYY